VSTWIVVLLLRLRRKKVLFWGHLRFGAKDAWVVSRLRGFFYKTATGWLSYGHRGKNELVAHGIPEDAVHVIYNSLDYTKHLKLRHAALPNPSSSVVGGTGDCPMFICVSRLVRKRRLDMLFAAMAELAKRGRLTRLLLVGDGPEREALQQLASDLGLIVVFYGACYDESQLRELYRGAVATVAPGEVGLTAIQSLSFGVPVVTHGDMISQMPEAESVVEGVTGWLFEKDDQSSLEKALERALSSNIALMREICYQMIDNFFNPRKQVQVITRASLELPANENDWHLFIESIKNENLAKSEN
jgi:glycosyltransferase involved in cell wall biosynthesis